MSGIPRGSRTLGSGTLGKGYLRVRRSPFVPGATCLPWKLYTEIWRWGYQKCVLFVPALGRSPSGQVTPPAEAHVAKTHGVVPPHIYSVTANTYILGKY